MLRLVTQLAVASLLLRTAPAAHGQALNLSALAGSAAPRPAKSAYRRAARPAKHIAPARWQYVPTVALRQQTVRAEARQLQARHDQPGAQALRRAFGPGRADYDQLYTTLLRESGFADNDAASALALYLEAGYRIANDIFDDETVTPAMETALRQQAAGLLAQQPGRATPAAVARLGEQLKLRSVLLTLGWQEARRAGRLADFRATVARHLRADYGLAMSEWRITGRGLVEK